MARRVKEAVPNIHRAAVLFGSDTPIDLAMLRAAEAVAPSLGVTINAINILDGNIERAVADFSSQSDGGLIVLPHRYTLANRGSIIILAAGQRLPAVYPFPNFAAEGGLLAYGPDRTINGAERRPTSTASCGVRSRATFLFKRRPSSSL